MTTTLSQLQSAASGSILKLVQRQLELCTRIEASEPTDAQEYVREMYQELAVINEALLKMGVNLQDVHSPNVVDEPYEIWVQAVV